MLGASWRTDLVGYIALGGSAMGLIADIIATQGMPKTIPEYVLFGGLALTGIGHILAKDGKVSNAENPVSPKDVPKGI